MDPKVNEDALEDGLAKLERARGWSPRVVSRLEHDIRSAEDAHLFRMNPLQWATDRGVDEYEAVDLFLHSAKAGLVDMDWNVICPCCGRIMHRFRELHDLQSQNSCTVCYRKDRSTLDDYIQAWDDIYRKPILAYADDMRAIPIDIQACFQNAHG